MRVKAYFSLSALLTSLTLSQGNLLAETISSPFVAAQSHSIAGEINNLYLSPPGAFFQLMNNDFAGETDKLLTGSTLIGLMRRYSTSSLAVALQWRAVTPTYTYFHGSAALEKPQGIFADWLDLTPSYSRVFDLPTFGLWRVQASAGISHIGNKGMREIQNGIHKALGADRQYFDYRNQPEGVHYSADGQLGHILPECSVYGFPLRSLMNIGYYVGPGKRSVVAP